MPSRAPEEGGAGSSEWATCAALQSMSISIWLVIIGSNGPAKSRNENFHGATGPRNR